jgi:hypothetical protein
MTAIDQMIGYIEDVREYKYNDAARELVFAYLEKIPERIYSRLTAKVFEVPLYRERLPLPEHFKTALAMVYEDQSEERASKPYVALIEDQSGVDAMTEEEKESAMIEIFARLGNSLAAQGMAHILGFEVKIHACRENAKASEKQGVGNAL